ncbi:MAG TPA: GNAT family N-acetyltransferase [Gryllotalpicola sp.]
MEIRLRTDADLPALLDALQATHEADQYPVLPTHVTSEWLLDGDDGMAWVAEEDDRVVGHVAVAEADEDPEALSVHRLFVRPDARSQGVASALLTTVETYARLLALDLFLEVVSHNTGAMHLYESRGWTRVGGYTAVWTAPDGTHPVISLYAAPNNDRTHVLDPGAGKPTE